MGTLVLSSLCAHQSNQSNMACRRRRASLHFKTHHNAPDSRAFCLPASSSMHYSPNPEPSSTFSGGLSQQPLQRSHGALPPSDGESPATQGNTSAHVEEDIQQVANSSKKHTRHDDYHHHRKSAWKPLQKGQGQPGRRRHSALPPCNRESSTTQGNTNALVEEEVANKSRIRKHTAKRRHDHHHHRHHRRSVCKGEDLLDEMPINTNRDPNPALKILKRPSNDEAAMDLFTKVFQKKVCFRLSAAINVADIDSAQSANAETGSSANVSLASEKGICESKLCSEDGACQTSSLSRGHYAFALIPKPVVTDKDVQVNVAADEAQLTPLDTGESLRFSKKFVSPERWAGSAYFSSPSPRAVPIPSFPKAKTRGI